MDGVQNGPMEVLLKKETKAKAFLRRSRPCGLSAFIIFESYCILLARSGINVFNSV